MIEFIAKARKECKKTRKQGSFPLGCRILDTICDVYCLQNVSTTKMKRTLIRMKHFLFVLTIISATALHAQTTLPEAMVEDVNGIRSSTTTFENDGAPMIISFWATWCKPCLKELAAIEEVYEDWADETGVKLIAISVDDSRSAPRVRSFVLGSGWEYEVYLDKNGDFKRAMNVVNIPHTFLLDGEGNIVYQHTSYAPGDEDDLYEKILELVE